jgi:peptidoglycan/xylan/chitin deacetylase (PgdA/CDA1 family)
MLHHITEELFQLPLEKFLLTFDDGYSDHYMYFSRFLEVPTEKVYFITCKWVGQSNFLTIDQIKHMSSFDNVRIGAHSYEHYNINELDIEEKIKFITQDTIKCCDWFLDNLGYIPADFCFPNNNNAYGIYTEILKKYGFTNFYGVDRITPKNLTDKSWLQYNRL